MVARLLVPPYCVSQASVGQCEYQDCLFLLAGHKFIRPEANSGPPWSLQGRGSLDVSAEHCAPSYNVAACSLWQIALTGMLHATSLLVVPALQSVLESMKALSALGWPRRLFSVDCRRKATLRGSLSDFNLHLCPHGYFWVK